MATDDAQLPYGLTKYDADFLKSFHLTLKELRGLVISNVEFYQRGSSSVHARYYAASCILFERLQTVEQLVIDLVPRLQAFDFSPEIQGNGYRSFVIIVNRCILHLLQLCRHISVNKNSLLFRSTYYLKELEAYVETLGQLVACLCYLKKLISLSNEGDLFYEEENQEGDEILLEIEMLNTDTFYGRCLGFQFSESIQKLLQGIMVAMATFSECYEESSQVIQLASSLLNSSKYLVDQDMRAKQVVNVTRTADIKFCKAFWSIPESPVLHNLRSFTFPVVEVSEIITLQPENFDLPVAGRENDTVTITPPCAHTGPAPVNVRLISHVVREGMQVNSKGTKSKKGSVAPQPKSAGLLFHCHGGGFVAQSSQSHENYLRAWARKLKMPILSVDYSLAPALPFPRALEECFYSYAWALKNPDLLGWSGDLVCFAGDSAGGNLVISTALRAVSYQIRVPDGIMAAYTPMLVQYTPSPARLMAMIDPLLPVGILTRCLAAYAGIADKFSSALAEPIFCNPGKYEQWEVVDSDDVATDSIGAQINKKLKYEGQGHNDTNMEDQGQVLDVSDSQTCLTNASQGEMSDVPNAYRQPKNMIQGAMFDARNSQKGLMNETSASCHSLEDLDDEFVVCETDDLERDVLHYKGKVTVIGRESSCDSNTGDYTKLAIEPSQNGEIIDHSKVEDVVDEKMEASENGKAVTQSFENIEGKEENADDQHFLLFPQCCPKDQSVGYSKATTVTGESDCDNAVDTSETCDGSVSNVANACTDMNQKTSSYPDKASQPETTNPDVNNLHNGAEITSDNHTDLNNDNLKPGDNINTHARENINLQGDNLDCSDDINTDKEGVNLNSDNPKPLQGMKTDTRADMHVSDSITAALAQLDSDVVITVENGECLADTEAEGAIGGAITADQDDRFMTVNTLSEFDRTSCHSIEDINEKINNEENKKLINNVHKNEKVMINGDLVNDVTDNPVPNCSSSKSSLEKRSHSEPLLEACDETYNGDHLQEGSAEDGTNIQSDKHIVNSNLTGAERLRRRSFSLELPPSFHGSQSSSDLASMSRTPLSPQLPPGSRSFTPKRYSVQRKITQSPIKLFRQLPIVKNFYMSPILAPDELLLGLPDIYLTACHFDPLLDDSIMFAKKLSALGKNVKLQLMDHLPHGFLSFSDTSMEAKKAANVCLDNIKKVLQCDES